MCLALAKLKTRMLLIILMKFLYFSWKSLKNQAALTKSQTLMKFASNKFCCSYGNVKPILYNVRFL